MKAIFFLLLCKKSRPFIFILHKTQSQFRFKHLEIEPKSFQPKIFQPFFYLNFLKRTKGLFETKFMKQLETKSIDFSGGQALKILQ